MSATNQRNANTCGVDGALRTMGVKYVLHNHYKIGNAPNIAEFKKLSKLFDIWNRLNKQSRTQDEKTGDTEQKIKLTGTAGTATVTICDDTYLVTFDEFLATTADNFVELHAATILTANGLVVTAEKGYLIFTGCTNEFPRIKIENTTEDLSGTRSKKTDVVTTIPWDCGDTFQNLTELINKLTCIK